MAVLVYLFLVNKISTKLFVIKEAQFLILFLCILMPPIFERLDFRVGWVIWFNFYLFVLLAIFVGSILNIYDKFAYFDVIVHFYSGVLFSIFAFSFSKYIPSRLLRCIFCISFATTIGVVWEFYEFSFDRLLGLNMQRTANVATLEPFVGWRAIEDTMLDLFCDFSGALAASWFCFSPTGLNDRFLIQKNR